MKDDNIKLDDEYILEVSENRPHDIHETPQEKAKELFAYEPDDEDIYEMLIECYEIFNELKGKKIPKYILSRIDDIQPYLHDLVEWHTYH